MKRKSAEEILTLDQIDTNLFLFYCGNRSQKGSGYGKRLIQQYASLQCEKLKREQSEELERMRALLTNAINLGDAFVRYCDERNDGNTALIIETSVTSLKSALTSKESKPTQQ